MVLLPRRCLDAVKRGRPMPYLDEKKARRDLTEATKTLQALRKELRRAWTDLHREQFTTAGAHQEPRRASVDLHREQFTTAGAHQEPRMASVDLHRETVHNSWEAPPFMSWMDTLLTQNARLLQGLVHQTHVSPIGATHGFREGSVASANCSREVNSSSASLLGRGRGGSSASASSSSIHSTSVINGGPDVAGGTGSLRGEKKGWIAEGGGLCVDHRQLNGSITSASADVRLLTG